MTVNWTALSTISEDTGSPEFAKVLADWLKSAKEKAA
jgi:hypothetical protein